MKLEMYSDPLIDIANSNNTLWPCANMRRHRSRTTLAQVIACWLAAPSHYLNKRWLMILRAISQRSAHTTSLFWNRPLHAIVSLPTNTRGELSSSIPYRYHYNVIKWKHFPRHWPCVRGVHRSSVNSPHKDQWRGVLMFSLICTCLNKRLNKQSRRRWFETPSCSLWRHCNVLAHNEFCSEHWNWGMTRIGRQLFICVKMCQMSAVVL